MKGTRGTYGVSVYTLVDTDRSPTIQLAAWWCSILLVGVRCHPRNWAHVRLRGVHVDLRGGSAVESIERELSSFCRGTHGLLASLSFLAMPCTANELYIDFCIFPSPPVVRSLRVPSSI
jgi:hypothetical protein